MRADLALRWTAGGILAGATAFGVWLTTQTHDPTPPLTGYEQLVVDECNERGQDWRPIIDRAGDGAVLGIRCYSPTRGRR